MSRVEVNRIKVGLYEKLLEKGALSRVEVNRIKVGIRGSRNILL